jgi:hypothetical protein
VNTVPACVSGFKLPLARWLEISGTSTVTPHMAGVTALWAGRILVQGPLSPVLLQSKLIGFGTFMPRNAARVRWPWATAWTKHPCDLQDGDNSSGGPR